MLTEAGRAFSRAAEVYLDNGNRYEAATQFVAAATNYRKVDPAGKDLDRLICLNYYWLSFMW